ncbi:MAG: DUF1963 domain-containing protein [Oscillospiraceae bacterium]|nr:DUF1963 domain-containing protein [Oscillospiraceae bacterium]
MSKVKGNLDIALKTAEKVLSECGTTPSVRFKLTDNNNPTIFESKVGGIPYMPKDFKVPVDGDGIQLRLLMQIRCSDVTGCDIFPKKGILQFWISANEVWGMEIAGYKAGYRVIYYDTIDETVNKNDISAKISEMTEYEKEYFPVKGVFGVEFYPCTETIPTRSNEYQKLFCKYYNELSDEKINSLYDFPFDILNTILYSIDSSYGHKIGGSSDYCQFEPREGEELEKYNFQLLQLSSDFKRHEQKIMWGDAGIGHFFINSEKLKNCDFSDIFYYADCC